MSVNTSEEYLDELLQAIEPIIYMNEPVAETEIPQVEITEEADAAVNFSDNLMQIPAEEPAFSAVEEIAMSEEENGLADLLPEEPAAEDADMNDLLAALASESAEEAVAEEEAFDIDAMLNAAMGAAESEPVASEDYDADVKALLQQFTDDEDLSDIGEILERHDNSEAVDESVLETPEVEVFQMEEENTQPEEEKKESKGLFGFFKKKKDKKGKKNKEEEAVSEEAVMEELPAGDTVEIMEEASMEMLPEMDFFAEAEAAPVAGAEEEAVDLSGMSLDEIFSDGDMTDIEQLLSAGSFDEDATLMQEGDVASADGKNAKKGDKKESFFSKLFTMLTEEDEEEAPKKGSVPEADATGITDENETILEELSKEEKKKRKKEEKEQKKKEKEAKKKGKAAPDGEGSEEEEEGDDKKDKKEKKKKIKKEKPRKVVDIDSKPEKKLSRKKVTVIFAFCFSILAMILILQKVLLDLSNVKDARWAYDNADYETCYTNLYGQELSEEDEAIFQKSYIILCVQRKWDSYENFKQMDMGVEALDALFEGVRVYRELDERAESLGVSGQITAIFENIYSELRGYGLSEADIEEILAYESKVSYTKRLESIVNGTPFVVDELIFDTEEVEEVIEPQPLEDVLPQEEDFLPDDTSLVNEMNQASQTEQEVSQPAEPEQGNTVVVGSSPVDIDVAGESTEDLGGTNVGSGSTNISAEVSGDSVFVN